MVEAIRTTLGDATKITRRGGSRTWELSVSQNNLTLRPQNILEESKEES